MFKANRAIDSMRSEFAEYGLLLCDVKSVTDLPEAIWLEPFASREVHFNSGSLLLVGHAGKTFWDRFSQSKFWLMMPELDPVDNYSSEITQRALDTYLPDTAKQQLFPATDCPVNLMALGREFGWHAPSPLGMGIHEKYGLWSAYRAVWWLDAVVQESINSTLQSKTSDLCAQCLTQDCVTACPGQAIAYNQNPDLSRCAGYRLEDNSQCASTCLSRMACPYASEHRYTKIQMRYHYDLARSAIARYRNQS